MRWNVTFDVTTQRLPVFLGKGTDFFQGPIIEVILQLIREIGIFCRLMLSSPREAVIIFPFPLKGFTVARPGPELRFLQVDDINPRIDDPLDVHFLHVFQEI